jgi:hypothetical protein
MNQASFFIEKKALFGGYPNHNQIIELKEEGVVWFIDLTNNNERGITQYSHLVDNWINFPIKDGWVPENKKKPTRKKRAHGGVEGEKSSKSPATGNEKNPQQNT